MITPPEGRTILSAPLHYPARGSLEVLEITPANPREQNSQHTEVWRESQNARYITISLAPPSLAEYNSALAGVRL